MSLRSVDQLRSFGHRGRSVGCNDNLSLHFTVLLVSADLKFDKRFKNVKFYCSYRIASTLCRAKSTIMNAFLELYRDALHLFSGLNIISIRMWCVLFGNTFSLLQSYTLFLFILLFRLPTIKTLLEHFNKT